YELRAGAERRPARGFGGELAYQADRHHPQASRRAAGSEAMLEPWQLAEAALEVGETRPHPDHDVAGDGRRALPGAEKPRPFEVDRTQLRIRAPEVDQQGRAHASARLRSAMRAPRREILRQPCEHGLDPGPRRRRAIEAHVE